MRQFKRKLWACFGAIFILLSPFEASALKSKHAGNFPQNVHPLIVSTITTAKEDEGIKVDIEGIMGNTPFTIKGNLGKLTHALQPEWMWPVHLTVETANTRLDVTGTIKDLEKMEGINLNLVLTGQNLDELSDMFGKKLPAVPPFTLKANLRDKTPLFYELGELQLTMGESRLKGSCSMDISSEKPRIKAAFFSPYLDLRVLLGSNKSLSGNTKHMEVPVEKTSEPDAAFSGKPINLNVLNICDVELEILAEKLFLPRLAFKEFHFKTTLENGALIVDSLAGKIGDGRMVGTLEIKPFQENIDMVAFLDIEHMELESMLQDMELNVDGKGLLDIHLDLNSQGDSMAALMADLDGNASLIMGKGRVDSRYLDFLGLLGINLISSLMNIFDISMGFDKQKDVADTNCFVIRFDISEGLANLSALVLDTPQTTFIGNGNINLASEKLDISLRTINKEGIGAENLIKINLSLSQLTRVFYLGGTLTNPVVTIDTTQTFLTLGKAIGGVVLFGPAGIAAALLSGKVGKNSQNPCLEAIEEAQKGVEIKNEKTGIFNFMGNIIQRLNPFN